MNPRIFYGLLLITLLLSNNSAFSQPANSPYPVIVVHGLNSDDNTWSTLLTKLSAGWIMSSNHTLNAVLNARGGDTTNYLQDVLILNKDVPGNPVNLITSSSIYAVNFNNFWNRNPDDPRIILYNITAPGSNQNASNQSAIYKQAYALSKLIDSVIRVTGAEKVVLLGHSMGGLAIREYLQRRESGLHKWWVNPADSVNGHKVAKVITIGTPHLGTNVSIPVGGVDFSSEAIRDMRISYPSGGAVAAYLFGNVETAVPGSYYNKDVNCNGSVTDTITGIDSNTTDNPLIPLPVNILYTYIMSNYLNLGTDLAVPLSSQALYELNPVPDGVSDTLMTSRLHTQETNDVRSLVRALDEPDTRQFAYKVESGKTYSGYITLQSGGVVADSDYYKIQTTSYGQLRLTVNNVSAGVTGLAILSESGLVLANKTMTGSTDSLMYKGMPATYFIRINGSSASNPNQNFHTFNLIHTPSLSLNLTSVIQGMWNSSVQVSDTVQAYLRNSSSPFNKTDSASGVLNASGNVSLTFINAPAGNYYIELDHRNALQTWSSSALNFTNAPVNYDFTDSQSKAYGNNLVLKEGKWCVYSGDVDDNENISLNDIVLIYNDATAFASGYVKTDLTGDNITGLNDLVLAYNNAAGFVMAIVP